MSTTSTHQSTPPGDAPASAPTAAPPWFDPSRMRWPSLLGLVAATTGLGAGEAVAGLLGRTSPVVAVGDLVVDNVPGPVKQLAIDLFGTNDKLALIVGIVVLLALAALGLGRFATHDRSRALIGTGVFGAIGVVAVLVRSTATSVDTIPSLVAGAVAVAVLAWLTVPRVGSNQQDGRRTVLLGAGAAVALGAVGTGLGRFAVARRGRAVEQARVGATLPAPREPVRFPRGVSLDIDGLSPYETPNGDFYRIDTALEVPRLSRDGWTLTVTGMVDEPMTLTMDELEQRYEIIERAITLTCVSNEIGGGLAGNARWRGVRLADVLEDVGVDGAATQVVGRAFDDFTTGFPVEAAFDRDALLAIGMNDEPLPAVHGYPLRLVVPGLYGYVSATKWLSEIELTTFEDVDQYWVERDWADRAPIKTQSRIDTPTGFARLSGVVAIAGVAWAQTRGIEVVEVRIDGGEWQRATLSAAFNAVTWRQWVFEWDTTDVEPGRHDVQVRATDGTGEVQTDERAPVFPDGATGWHSVVVTVADD